MPQYLPDFATFRTLAAEHTVVPVARELFSDTLTPVMAAAKVCRTKGAFLLESVAGGEKWGRYSFVGFEPDLFIRGQGDRFERVDANGEEVLYGIDPWERLRAFMSSWRAPTVPWLPRFWGGAVGYVSYDAVRRFEPTVGRARDPDPAEYEFSFVVGGTLLVFDSVRQMLQVVVPVHVQSQADLQCQYDGAIARIDAAVDALGRPAALRRLDLPDPLVGASLPPSSLDAGQFCRAVEKSQEHIRAGDIFQVVLSQQLDVGGKGVDLFDAYRTMRVINPSPYMYFLRLPEVTIAGASPGTLVRVEGQRAEVRPIAGTRPRGKDEATDQALEEELRADPKERAEHVMLVDLGRNDLGRVCKPGTVEVTERMLVERYSHVMHLVSNVCGEVMPDKNVLDVLRATFPAGTLTGAPKVRAMQIIDELELVPRGIYGGAVGYLSFTGNLDMAIAIRTIVERDGELTVQAGAGIVEASVPMREYEETRNKAKAALVAIEAARR